MLFQSWQSVVASTYVTWHFFTALHGKGLVDGICGSAQQYISNWNRIKGRQVLVKDSDSFVASAATIP